MLTKFLNRRLTIVERARKRTHDDPGDDDKNDGGRKTKLSRVEKDDIELSPPPGQRLPWADYKKLHKGKLLNGHKRVKTGRRDGVFMPGNSHADAPWTVQRKFVFGAEKTEELA